MAKMEPAVKALVDKATALVKQNKTEEARKIYQQALAQAQDAGVKEDIQETLNNL